MKLFSVGVGVTLSIGQEYNHKEQQAK